MSHDGASNGLTRRDLLKTGALAAGAAAVLPARPAAAQLKTVARNRTLSLVWIGSREGRWVDFELWNPYSIGSNHQNGPGILYEPLAFYSAFADKEYLWLAESYRYSPDFKELTIKTRSGIKWSDGTPFSAEDVAYTLTSLRDLGPKVRWGVDVQQFMQEARATDANTVVIKFKVPAPRFFFFLTYKYDIGVYIVPKHIFQGQDWTTFKHFDVAKGWPVTTGPWTGGVLLAPAEGDRPPGRVVGGQGGPGADAQGRAQHLAAQRDRAAERPAPHLEPDRLRRDRMQPATFPTIFRQNPKIITHSGQKPPYGYMDWWPISLYVNNERPPFDDKDVRWALSYFIDRQQIVDVGYLGASLVSPLPLPEYPALKPYIDGVKDLLAKYNTLEYNPKKGEALLTRKGWKKDAQGVWVDAQGNRLKLDIIGFGSSGPAIGPVLVELLKRQGVDASMSLPPDFDDRFQKGQYTGAIYGHGGGVNDPYYTLRLYQSSTVAVPGAHLVNFARWKNEAYNKIVDDVFVTDMRNKTRLMELFHKAMEIWLPELPDIPLVHNIHRIPMNTTYWQNWPTAETPYVNGAFWHLTYAMVLWNLQPTQ